jgi:hypothetical protein
MQSVLSQYPRELHAGAARRKKRLLGTRTTYATQRSATPKFSVVVHYCGWEGRRIFV